jgi:maltooligosyltrehalose trehalohydrolase
MTELAVWAPRAGKLEVQLGDGRRLAMVADDASWYRLTLPPGTSGPAGHVDYGFCLDGGEPLPDPRSRWQPDGVHGLSRTFDPDAYHWNDDGFVPRHLSEAVIYEIHVGTFTGPGTFLAAIERLEHLVDLGVTHVELMPVAAFAGRHGWGYDGVDLYAPHPAYGNPRDLQQLVDACHAKGLAVLLDVVYNHLGPEGNYLARFGPYFTDRYVTPWGDAVNLDGPDSDEVRRFFVDNATMWLRDYRVDGLRLDAMHAAVDTSPVHLLEQLRVAADEVAASTGRPKVLTAEFEGNNPRIVQPASTGGYGLDAHWNDDVHHALHTALTGEHDSYYQDFDGGPDVVRCLREGYAYAGRYSRYRRRTIGRAPVGLDGSHLVAFLQNHDHIGNRARGDRIGTLAGHRRQKIGAALVLTSPFVPLLFQGEDWAASSPFPYFADHDGELAEAVRRGRLGEFAAFGWDPADVADPEDETTFHAAKLVWDERRSAAHADMLTWYRALLRLRVECPELATGHFGVTTAWDARRALLTTWRGSVLVAATLAADPVTVPFGEGAPARVLAASDPEVAVTGGALQLPGESVAVVATA